MTLAAVKLCPECETRKDASEFYPEPNDAITGLSAICVECSKTKKRTRGADRKFRGWTCVSPAGLAGRVLKVREEEGTVAVHFKTSRTVVLPLRKETR